MLHLSSLLANIFQYLYYTYKYVVSTFNKNSNISGEKYQIAYEAQKSSYNKICELQDINYYQNKTIKHLVQQEEKSKECIICYEILEDKYVSDQCHHGFYCLICLDELLKKYGFAECPICRGLISKKIGPIRI